MKSNSKTTSAQGPKKQSTLLKWKAWEQMRKEKPTKAKGSDGGLWGLTVQSDALSGKEQLESQLCTDLQIKHTQL